MYELSDNSKAASLRWQDVDAVTGSVHSHPAVKDALHSLAKYTDNYPVQLTFHLPKSPDFYAELRDFAKRFSDLRIVTHKRNRRLDATSDIRQLADFPKLRRLKIELSTAEEVRALACCTSLKELRCSLSRDASTGNPDLMLYALEALKNLCHLSVDGNIDGISWIDHNPQLKRLTISGSLLENLDQLKSNKHLKILRLDDSHALENIDALSDTAISYLYLSKLLKLERISCIPSVKHFELRGLSQIATLPTFEGWSNLQVLVMESLCNLRDLSPLLQASGLKQLKIMGAQHMEVADFEVLKQHPSLSTISIATGSPEKNAAIEKMLPYRVKQDIPLRDPELQKLLSL